MREKGRRLESVLEILTTGAGGCLVVTPNLHCVPSNGLKQIVGYWFSQITSQFCKERKVVEKRSITIS